MDSVDFTNLLKIISPLSISAKETIEKFIDKKNNEKINNIEKFYNTIEATSATPKTTTSTTTSTTTPATTPATKEISKETTREKIFKITYNILNVLLGLWAASISWKVNTIGHWSIIIKIIFSITAFFLAPLYLLLHFLFRYECLSNLNPINNNVTTNTSENKSKSIFSFLQKKNTDIPSQGIPIIPIQPTSITPSVSLIKNTKPPNTYISNANNSLNNTNTNITNTNINKI
jgi:hypothetical protein